jgi:hypothetical protein
LPTDDRNLLAALAKYLQKDVMYVNPGQLNTQRFHVKTGRQRLHLLRLQWFRPPNESI